MPPATMPLGVEDFRAAISVESHARARARARVGEPIALALALCLPAMLPLPPTLVFRTLRFRPYMSRIGCRSRGPPFPAELPHEVIEPGFLPVLHDAGATAADLLGVVRTARHQPGIQFHRRTAPRAMR